MGEDGHVASLFPPLERLGTEDSYQAVIAPKPPPERITLTYPTIAAAQNVWVLASGSGKADALRESLTAGAHTPLGRVLAMRQKTTIYSDIRG
jgi:6-phosphogluconolactonase